MALTLGLDLGQAQDYSALVLVGQRPTDPAPRPYVVAMLHRWPLGTPYPVIIEHTVATMRRPQVRQGQATLLVDYTGVGRAVVDSVRQREIGRAHV